MLQNVLVGQSDGPTSVINASLAGVYQNAVRRGVKHVYGMRNGIQGFIGQMNTMADQHESGEIDYRIDASLFNGDFRTMAIGVNKMVAHHLDACFSESLETDEKRKNVFAELLEMFGRF